MKKENKKIEYLSFERYLAKELKNSEFKKYYNEYGKQLEIAYQILQLRKNKKMSQAELAKKIGTKQSNIARMETGQQNFTIEILQRIASVFNCKLRVKFSK